MPTFEMPLFFDDVTANVKFADLPTPSGSVTNTGLYLADDSADPTSSTLGTNAPLVDGDVEVVAQVPSTDSWSIGVDQGQAYTATMFSLYDDGTAGSGILASGSNDSLTLYQSTDNSTWSLVKLYHPLLRTQHSGSISVIHLACDTTQRYLKVYSDRGALQSATGLAPQFTEVDTWQQQDTFFTSGSTFNVISSTIPTGQVSKREDILTAYRTDPIPVGRGGRSRVI
jgi:hypothetical protein